MTQPPHGHWQQPHQPYPPQQPYDHGWQPQPPQPQNGMGTAGFVCSLVSLAVGFLPSWLSLIALPLAILGVTFGSIGYGYANRGMANNRGLAQSGVVIGIIALVLMLSGVIIMLVS
ncbi:DUF4190 domain-containing protein [Amycolatopsis granulosa]|uniref:DUF4190 domain-containing protein n=1 Tax=Amycolatopsis granulosa TaxID=185684 RepID=UPI00142282A2|nr:DUF4190 domain-containing protein [Amycolatopsis granulosa]NIH84329.1 hypothetical protein [Amycolatopsis granulosa]